VKNSTKYNIFYYIVAGSIAIGSLCFSIGKSTARTVSPELNGRVKSLELIMARWDERWKFVENKLTSMDRKLDELNGRTATE